MMKPEFLQRRLTFFLHRTSWHHNTSKGFKRTYWEGHIRIRKVRMCVFNPLATFSEKPFVVGRQCSVTWRLLSSSNTLTFKTTWDSVVEAPWRHCKNAMQWYDIAGYTCLFIYIILYREVHQSKSNIKVVNCGVMHSYRTTFFMCVSFGETAVCVCVCAALTVHPCVFHVPYAPCSLSTLDKVWSVDMYGDVWNISILFSHFCPVSQDMVRRHPMARLHALTDSRKIRPGVSQYGALSYDRLPVAQGHHNPSIHHFPCKNWK